MGISCDIVTISYTDCILTISNSLGSPINEFNLGTTKILVNDTKGTIYITDGLSEITINLAQLPSINGGIFVTLADLATYLETQRNLCQCGCGGGGGSQDLEQVLTVGNDGGGLEILNILDPLTPQSASTKNYTDVQDVSTLASAEAYADALVVGLWDDRGVFDASVNAYPSSGGSGTAGAILKGDIWTISVAGTLPTGQVVEIGDVVRALINTPANLQSNWAITQNNIGYVPENVANKTNAVVGNETSTTLYLSVKGYYDYLVGLFWLTAQLFGTWIVGLSAKTTPINADSIIISDSADTNKTKKVSFTDQKAFFKTYFDTLYLPTALTTGQIFLGVGGVATASAHPRTVITTIPLAAVGASSTLYFLPGSAVAANASESARTYYLNNDCTLERLIVSTATTQSGTGSAVVTIRHSGASTSMTVTIAAGSAAGRFTDYTHSEACSVGDGISIQVVNNATANSCTFTQISFNSF